MSARPEVRSRSRARLRLSVAGLAATAALAALVQPVQATGTPTPPHKDLRQQLNDLVRTAGGPPGVIVTLRQGDRTKVYRAGVADTSTGRPLRATDHMRIASVAKAYSGAVALRLVDRHKLDLDDTIGERLPSLPVAWHQVTLRQLLNHTSGLPDFSRAPAFLEILQADPRHHFDSRRLLDFVADKDLLFPPGSRYEYSNSDNIAVALMAEAATGRPYERLLDRLLYQPLDLRQTSLPQGYRLPEPYLHGYDVTPPAPPEDISELIGASGVWASGGIVSTPKDLNTFIRAWAGGRDFLSKKTRHQQRTFIPGAASEPAGPGVNAGGLAIFRYTTRCGTVYGHTGNFPGYTQFAAGTADGKRSLTFSITTQTSKTVKPELLAKVRAVQEDFVCALLRN
ncbi:beta-lactamase family protein [Streptomyces gardneri]|uniref:serine hydrolase domain-containing protein n=1 Tax=Streptomyces gardneri TaxID=66892 RepID=UPI0006BD9AD3|nr:serine hydrolase domain-containing protein [Streptomyces gardneri]QPK49742.1 beta-lactamase family protein [Streptomyces gardneri]WRK41302.1 serine hydrolase domain-containing protein [Streptomyces venezuelae]CUM36259.1 Beta-lactamase class C and other penicillin binding proteins [Streptomyces venezuelae]